MPVKAAHNIVTAKTEAIDVVFGVFGDVSRGAAGSYNSNWSHPFATVARPRYPALVSGPRSLKLNGNETYAHRRLPPGGNAGRGGVRKQGGGL